MSFHKRAIRFHYRFRSSRSLPFLLQASFVLGFRSKPSFNLWFSTAGVIGRTRTIEAKFHGQEHVLLVLLDEEVFCGATVQATVSLGAT